MVIDPVVVVVVVMMVMVMVVVVVEINKVKKGALLDWVYWVYWVYWVHWVRVDTLVLKLRPPPSTRCTSERYDGVTSSSARLTWMGTRLSVADAPPLACGEKTAPERCSLKRLKKPPLGLGAAAAAAGRPTLSSTGCPTAAPPISLCSTETSQGFSAAAAGSRPPGEPSSSVRTRPPHVRKLGSRSPGETPSSSSSSGSKTTVQSSSGSSPSSPSPPAAARTDESSRGSPASPEAALPPSPSSSSSSSQASGWLPSPCSCACSTSLLLELLALGFSGGDLLDRKVGVARSDPAGDTPRLLAILGDLLTLYSMTSSTSTQRGWLSAVLASAPPGSVT
ncbi:hypothetical protein EYF80_022198 [Liparis tanakae]|uniref:Uncharacterized protein n=1 Tax=Liparis tanakae TaxID=230148 RepID=A0A4Z2HQG1_9TELE|nr:hypothetical protein EYF80_022198 [Liparis tanakae]